jgi:predicted kinase/CRISPR/Cas system-associated endonuclease Cas3-HD
MSDTTRFQTFIKQFQTTQLWSDMEKCVENSPWHRESNVAEHTMMLYRFYRDNLMSSRTKRQQILTFLAMMFHDVGKPSAKVEKYREDRGNYFVFAGHEQISARLWEDYAVGNWSYLKNLFPEINIDDIFRIGFIIENHLPFTITNQKALEKFSNAVHYTLESDKVAYFDCLTSDQHGRISDNQEEKLNRFNEWMEKFCNINNNTIINNEENINKVIYLLIGASGSGKSTYANSIRHQYGDDNVGVFSLDTCRLDFAKNYIVDWETKNDIDFYREAFALCVSKQNEFNVFADKSFRNILDKFDYVISDNTNVSKKSRHKWTMMAHNKGFKVIGVLFPINKEKLLNRMVSRVDKKVPEEAVLRQWNQISYPRIGDDVDGVFVVSNNI